MKTRADVRKELENLRAEVARAGIGVMPLVVTCFRHGGGGWDNVIETRAPGVYRTGENAEVVFEGDNPPEEVLAQFRPKNGEHGAIIVISHADYIEPPTEGA